MTYEIKDEDGDTVKVNVIHDHDHGLDGNRLEVLSVVGAWITREQARELGNVLLSFAAHGEIT